MKVISGWKFDTSAGGSAGYGLFSVSGGLIRLVKPGSEETVDFKYRGIGGGPSYGLKMPQGTFAPTDFPSYGSVLKMPRCSKPELEVDDFLGPCAYVDLGGGLIAGWGGTVLFLGLPPWNPPSLTLIPTISKACIPMTGFTLMRQASVGVTVSRGVMYRENFTLGKSTENVSLPNKAFEAHPKRGIYGQNPPAVPLLNRGATTSY